MPTKSEEKLRGLILQSKEDFSNHVITKSGHGRWLMMDPKSTNFWVEVVILEGGHLLVHGDIQAVIFGRYMWKSSGLGTEPSQEEQINCIRWMAKRERPDDSYFVQKATIGGTAKSTIWDDDDDVFREEIEQLIQEARAEEEQDESDSVSKERECRIEALEEALSSIGCTPKEEIQTELYNGAFDYDSEGIPEGLMISNAMIHAHAALRQLLHLIETQSQDPTNDQS